MLLHFMNEMGKKKKPVQGRERLDLGTHTHVQCTSHAVAAALPSLVNMESSCARSDVILNKKQHQDYSTNFIDPTTTVINTETENI